VSVNHFIFIVLLLFFDLIESNKIIGANERAWWKGYNRHQGVTVFRPIDRVKINKEISIGLALFCLLSALLILATPSPGSQSRQKTFLWKVRSATGSAYILGSVHVLKKDFYPLPAEIEDAFREADALAVEANINKVDAGRTLSVLQGSLYPGNDTIERHISKETYDLARKRLGELGVPIEVFLKNKPWFLAMTLTALELSKLGFDPEYGIDKHFLDEAAGKKKILELESVQYQIDLFNNFSDGEQELFLIYTMKEMDQLRNEMGALTDAWRSGDAGMMDSIISGQLREEPRLSTIYEKLIYERNRELTSKIEDYLKSGEKCFVIVGAGHLIGNKGIIELLRADGYSVEQM
jgi:uncharacterized protein YbaP (TraB family)